MTIKNLLFRLFSKAAGGGVPISALDAAAALKEGKAILLDVREKRELERDGLAAPASWVATSEIQADSPQWLDFIAKLPREKDVVIYCAAGVRAGKAAGILSQKGFKTFNMGGFEQWRAAGLPVKPLNT